jgi:hypothetical protein
MSVPLLAYARVFCVLALVWIGRLPIARDHLDVVCKSVVILGELKEERPKIDRSICSTVPHLSRRRPITGGPYLGIIVQIGGTVRHGIASCPTN